MAFFTWALFACYIYSWRSDCSWEKNKNKSRQIELIVLADHLLDKYLVPGHMVETGDSVVCKIGVINDMIQEV